ncbi:MAG: branched-chain amino acid ABC transporter permease [Firmicutes bacterium]|nr:branched-chain amino acid ABC transporter permease [Bacillota bacterium]
MVLLQQIVNGLIIGGIYSLTAAGVALTYGVLQVLNLSQGDMYMVGAYIALALVVGPKLPYGLAVVAAFLGIALIGLVTERVALRPVRRSGTIYAYITTFAVSFILQNVAILVWTADPRLFPTRYTSVTLSVGGVSFTLQQLIVFIACWAIIGALYYLLRFTKMGLAIRSVSQSIDTASLMGIPVNRTISLTFALATGLAGVAGALIGPSLLVYPAMGSLTGMKIYAVILMGGLGNVFGATMAGFLLGAIEGVCAAFVGSTFRDVLPFVAIIAILLYKPSGLFTRSTS